MVDAIDDAAGIPVMSEIADHVGHQRQANRAPRLTAVVMLEMDGRAGARADERADSGPPFDPAIAFKLVKRSTDCRAAQLRQARQFMVGKEAFADSWAGAEQVLDELFSQRHRGPARRERSEDFKVFWH